MKSSTFGRTLGIIYRDHDGLGDDKPFTNKDTLKAYKLFSEYAAKKDLQVLLGKPDNYSDGCFTVAWDLIAGRKVFNTPFQACWDRNIDELPGDFTRTQELLEAIAPRMPLANHPSIVAITEDKYETSQRLPDFVPKTFLASELELARSVIKERAVTKPRFGSHGNDVEIRPIKEIKSLPEGFIIQPFIDSTKGIPGIIDGAHDLRVTLLNGIIVDTYIRYPQQGLISNMSRGGKMKTISVKELPSAVVEVVQKVDAHFASHSPRFYSIDFMLAGERPWVIELNKAPGIWGHIAVGISLEYFEELCTGIIDAFIEAIEKPTK
jgi:glutathione synthase/RimK-type ligase-like ATP-grasp enzyme